jgi:hypothetical protein
MAGTGRHRWESTPSIEGDRGSAEVATISNWSLLCPSPGIRFVWLGGGVGPGGHDLAARNFSRPLSCGCVRARGAGADQDELDSTVVVPVAPSGRFTKAQAPAVPSAGAISAAVAAGEAWVAGSGSVTGFAPVEVVRPLAVAPAGGDQWP